MQLWEHAEAEFKDSFAKRFGKTAYVYRIPDTKEAFGATKGGPKGRLRKTPSDFIITVNATMWYAEVKSCSNKTSFPFSAITEGEWNAMVRQKAAGGLYFLYIKNENTKQWYKVPAELILEVNSRKSLTWKHMEDYKWAI